MAGEKSLYNLLSNAAAVTAIVSTRIFPNRIPEKEDFPAISYQQITTVPADQKDAVSGFDKVDFDVDCWSNKYDGVTGVLTLAAAVRAALDRKTINSQGDNVNTIVFVKEFDSFDNAAELYHKAIQFRMIIIR